VFLQITFYTYTDIHLSLPLSLSLSLSPSLSLSISLSLSLQVKQEVDDLLIRNPRIVFIGSAPVFYSAAIYVTLAKIVEELDVSLSRIKPKLYYVIFIVCDVGSLVLQAAGG
jgi:hypothetical protein